MRWRGRRDEECEVMVKKVEDELPFILHQSFRASFSREYPFSRAKVTSQAVANGIAFEKPRQSCQTLSLSKAQIYSS